jgi:hypothetical protein
MGRCTSGLSGFGSAYVSIRPCSHLPCHANPLSYFSIGFLSWWLGKGLTFLLGLPCLSVEPPSLKVKGTCISQTLRADLWWVGFSHVDLVCMSSANLLSIQEEQSVLSNKLGKPCRPKRNHSCECRWERTPETILTQRTKNNVPQITHTTWSGCLCNSKERLLLRPDIIVQVLSAHFLQVRCWYLLTDTAPA